MECGGEYTSHYTPEPGWSSPFAGTVNLFWEENATKTFYFLKYFLFNDFFSKKKNVHSIFQFSISCSKKKKTYPKNGSPPFSLKSKFRHGLNTKQTKSMNFLFISSEMVWESVCKNSSTEQRIHIYMNVQRQQPGHRRHSATH